MRHAPARERLALAAAVALAPRAAFAHGEELVVALASLLATIPWGVIVFLVARRRVFHDAAQARLGPATLVTTLGTAFCGPAAMASLPDAIAHDAIGLTPLMLVVSGAPGVWYLLRERIYRPAIVLLLIPVILTVSCELAGR